MASTMLLGSYCIYNDLTVYICSSYMLTLRTDMALLLWEEFKPYLNPADIETTAGKLRLYLFISVLS